MMIHLLAAALSVIKPAGTIYSLSSLASNYADVNPATQTYAVEMLFQTDGTVDVFRDVAANLLNEQDPYVDPVSETTNVWVRCHFISGDTMTAGDTLEVWLQCNVQRRFTMRHTTGGGNDELSGVFDFELSSDSSGTPIVAQKLAVTINVGELF